MSKDWVLDSAQQHMRYHCHMQKGKKMGPDPRRIVEET